MPSQSLDTIGRVEFYVVVFFFSSKGLHLCNHSHKRIQKKKMAICLAWSKQSIKTNHIPSVNTNPGVRYSNIDFNSHNSST